ncbi:MAG: hypothetical protein AAB446_00655 [Patescibacteria group bacterium]
MEEIAMNKIEIIKEYGVEKIPENRYRGFDPHSPSLSPELKLDLERIVCDYYKENSPEQVLFIANQLTFLK